MRIIMLVVALAVTALAIAQPVYKWSDPQGVVHYGDEPPDDAKAQEVQIEPAPAREAGRTSGKSVPLDIVMYARADCGYCAKARRYFAERGIAYVEKDVQRNAQTTAEWKRLGGVGVPLFVINGAVSSGFDADAMTQRLARYGR